MQYCRHAARRFRPSARPHRLFAVGRGDQGQGAGTAVPGRADAGGCDHRYRQPVRRARIRHDLRRRRRAADHRLRDRARRGDRRTGSRLGRGRLAEPDRIVLLVQSEAGYRNLLRLVSRSYLAGEAPSRAGDRRSPISPAASEGLICLAGGAKGPVGRLLAEGQAEAAEAMPERAEGGVSGPALYRADAPRHGRRRRAAEPGLDRSRLSPRPAAGRDQRLPISPTATFTRRMTRCCASRRARWSPIPTAGG